MPYHSQYRQDELLDRVIFQGFRGGTFVDVGAHDGETYNNTLFFEEERGWTGINIEANPIVFSALEARRPACTNLCVAVDEREGTGEFLLNSGYTEMLSGLASSYDPRHMERLQKENGERGATTRRIQVQTRRLESILAEKGVQRVHYLSIDVEGAEGPVLWSIDFSKVMIDVIAFENNFADVSAPIRDYLREKGYYELPNFCTDIVMIHKSSPFAAGLFASK
jgi:FkbM family methyltransferase